MGPGIHPSHLMHRAWFFDKLRTDREGQSCQLCPLVVSLSNHVLQR